MSEALAKAKGALDQIREIGEGQFNGSDPQQLDLLTLARIQAEVAQAEVLERIADLFEYAFASNYSMREKVSAQSH